MDDIIILVLNLLRGGEVDVECGWIVDSFMSVSGVEC